MIETRKKFEAIMHFGQLVQHDGGLLYLLGFLAGRLDRLFFVRDLADCDIGIRLAAGRRTLWPNPPFQATIHSVPVPNPATFVSALSERDEDICLQLQFAGMNEAEWLQQVLVTSYAEAGMEPAETTGEQIEDVKERINHALDIYRECRAILEEGAKGREDEVRFYLSMAEQDIAVLSQELKRLTRQLEEEAGT